MTTERFEYRFEDCVLNSATRELRVHDEPKQIGPRVLDLLVCLIENRNRVVTKEELIALVWKGAALAEGVLAQGVRKARFAIGDLDPKPRLIKTMHRVGYRFIGDVQVEAIAPRGDRTRSSRSFDAGLGAGSGAARGQDPLSAGRLTELRPVAGARGPQWLTDAQESAASLMRFRANPATPMAVVVLDDDVGLWESVLPATQGAERLDVLLRLAWNLRQRDGRRADLLADEADAVMGSLALSDRQGTRARLALVRGEVMWLAGDLDAAGDLARQTIEMVRGLSDRTLSCDANLLIAFIEQDQGRAAQSRAHLEDALAAAHAAEDDVRATVAKLLVAISAVFADPAKGAADWAEWVATTRRHENAWIVALRERFEVTVCSALTGDSAQALAHSFAAIEAARAAGQTREMIGQMCNAASRLCLLGDFEGGLEWQESALRTARAANWPLPTAFALQQGALLLKALARFDDAAELLDESLDLLSGFGHSPAFCMALYYQGFMRFERKAHALALESFDRLIPVAKALGSQYILGRALEGRARSLAATGRIPEALALQQTVLELASVQGNGALLPYVLEGLAEIHGYPGVPAPDGTVQGSAKLHFLLQAISAHESLRKQAVPEALWQSLAAEHARLGDYERACAAHGQALAASEATRTTEAANRAVAMKVRHDTERARAGSDRHRALALAQAERAAAFARTNAILERLSLIGQEIAQQRGIVAVFEAMERHVHELLDTSMFALFVIDEAAGSLDLAFGVESGRQLPKTRVAVSDLVAPIARCWREQREISIEVDSGNPGRPAAATLEMPSALYAPLSVGARLLGVLTIRSLRARVFGERERLIFRTLAAHGAIALDHAKAYRRLERLLESRQLDGAEVLPPAQYGGEPPR